MPKHDPPMHVPGFFVRQILTLGVNRYEVRAVGPDGGPGELIAFAQQKRVALKEQVTFYADVERTRPIFSFKARHVADLSAGYDVFDEHGEAIGYFSKDFRRSLLRSTFRLNVPYLNAVGQERDAAVAILRRYLFMPLAFHFDFYDEDRLVMSAEREFTIGDRYTVTVPDRRLDFRVAAAMTVALDALMRR